MMPIPFQRIFSRLFRRMGLYDIIYETKVVPYAVAMSECLKNKNILITGGSSGIGLAIAEKCVKCGANVIITGRNIDKLQKAKESIENNKLKSIVWDVNDFNILEKKITEVFKDFNNKLDILINNAGISIRQNFGDISLDVWEKILNTNLKAPVFITQSVANKWISSNFPGVILNISSMAGEEPAFDAYGAAKTGLSNMTKGIALALAPHGIRINAISPGVVIGTDLRDLQRSIKTNENVMCDWIPLKRYAIPEEIAELAVFLISDLSAYMTGAIMICDGAGSLRRS